MVANLVVANRASKKTASPYGTWKSPITAELMTTKSTGFSFPRFFEKSLFWMEFRPADSARTVIVRRSTDGETQTLTTPEFSVQTKANEYGGCCYTVGNGSLFFVNAEDQRIYRQSLDNPEQVHPLSPTQDDKTKKAFRFADLIYDAQKNRIVAVAEIHHPSEKEPEALLISLTADSGELDTLAQGADFYAHPRVSPNGKMILWLEWHHPNMPWDETKLCIGQLDENGYIAETTRIGDQNESIFQPEWSPSNDVYFVSDRSEWWNIFRYDKGRVTTVYSAERECGLPLWQFGMTTWDFLDEKNIIVVSCLGAEWHMEKVCTFTGAVEAMLSGKISTYNHFSGLVTDSQSSTAAVIAASPNTQPELCFISDGTTDVVARSESLGLTEQDISQPDKFSFPTSEDDEAYGYFYTPRNQSYETPSNEKPPLIVLCHGGPTASTTAAFNLKVQFWTSRGFAVADINYRGSTGYGRSYRDKLKGNWGVYDVDDACAAAQYLVNQKLVDPDRLIIRGSSAGGYTVLSTLCFKDVFTAGCSLYGIGDLGALANDTHKFESRYTDSLIAPPSQSETYAERSPIQHIEGFNCPTIFFQGLKDKVVPPSQAESMVNALNNKNIPVALITYPNEAHGFRDPQNVAQAFNAELAFYGKIFGFETDSTVNDLEIHNLEPN